MKAKSIWYFFSGIFLIWGIYEFSLGDESEVLSSSSMGGGSVPYIFVIVGMGLIILTAILSHKFESIRNHEFGFGSFVYYTLCIAIFFGVSFWSGLFYYSNDANGAAPIYYALPVVLFFVIIRRVYKLLRSNSRKYNRQKNQYDYESTSDRYQNEDDYENYSGYENSDKNSSFSEDDLKQYFDILGLEESASPEEIKNKYRKLIKFYHPDSYQTNTEKLEIAEMKTKELTNAFNHLKDAGKV